ncbi:MAG: hypothetical protein MJZ08_02815 [Bacteroidaceae bacterium]|nr:hypothetical protein [Bacteroidaceae bacterium]
MEQQEYIERYEKSLATHLLRMLTIEGKLGGQILVTDDMTDKWVEIAPSYVADSVKEVADYPTVSLGWAMYLGMAVAKFWDDDWSIYNKVGNLYEYIRDKRGYDYMDEYVREEVLGLKGEEFDKTEKLVQSCAQQVLARIRHEQIEPQSPLAYHIYIASVRVLYQIGASVVLHSMGYKFEKIGD